MGDRVALWLRVSTDEQHIDTQRMQLTALADQRGYEIVHEYDISGVSAWRGGHQRYVSQVISEAAERRIDALLMVSIDRLSRGGIRDTLGILQRLSHAGIGVVSLREPELDTTGPYGELIVSISSYFARLESERISERTKAGMRRARQAGKHVGRPRGARDGRKRRKRKSTYGGD